MLRIGFIGAVTFGVLGGVASEGRAGVPFPYAFTIDPTASGLSANISISLSTNGTLIGNFDPASNPTGTRTKPGLFGPFGAEENVPVPTSVGLELTGTPQSSTAGSFWMDIQPGAGQATLANLSANFLHSGPVSLPVNLGLAFDSFRTRNPTSTYPGIPVTLPIGAATLSALTADQVGGPAPGVLTPTGPNRFAFVVAPLVELNATFEVLGNQFTIPSAPALLPLEGEIVLAGNAATLSSVRPIEFSNTVMPNLALPTIPLDLPTVLPPGETAHLLLDLLLKQIASGVNGTLTLNADGVLIPEPATLACVLLGALVMKRPRRRLN